MGTIAIIWVTIANNMQQKNLNRCEQKASLNLLTLQKIRMSHSVNVNTKLIKLKTLWFNGTWLQS